MEELAEKEEVLVYNSIKNDSIKTVNNKLKKEGNKLEKEPKRRRKTGEIGNSTKRELEKKE